MSRHLAPASDPLTIVIQHEGNGDEEHGQAAEQTARPANAQPVVHSGSKERKRCPERGTHEVVTRVDGRDVARIRVSKVAEHGHEEQKGAHGEEGGANNGHDPVDRGARRPPEPEEADRYQKGAEEGGREAQLRPDVAGLVELRLCVGVRVPEEGAHDDEGSDEDAEEGEALAAKIETVDAAKDDGERFEPAVHQGIDQRYVHVEGEADGLAEAQGERSDKSHHDGFLARHAFGVELGLTFQLVVAGKLAKAAGPAIKNVCRARLRNFHNLVSSHITE